MGTPPDPASIGEILRARYRRLPERLADLAGPTSGVVALSLYVAWSGRMSFALDGPESRMGLYRIALAEGQQGDLMAFLDHGLLVEQWPVLRKPISRHVREAWKGTFPELVQAAAPVD
ncbi:hypothetical protein JL475_13135 [Streptomyces sp. M2CJ-2]|uniref:hypothetical protein n=1 Tax=Streptomyces sp. M2CJ-2 TaxID=2803948 RepID=UPI0019277026|nr:hypothetical protein [Streptomyces sp. M2CJ-2]MBL3666921.1 hypothetical protein [Streptomyces sp. M2CJ-2]